MDQVRERRLRRVTRDLPSVDAILQNLKKHRMTKFRVVDDPDAILEARRRIRGAASELGRSVQTHYARSQGSMFGAVIPEPDEQESIAWRLSVDLDRVFRKADRVAEATMRRPQLRDDRD